MLLSSNFYSYSFVGTQEDASLVWELTFNAQHPIFDGHFPQSPVVPGVSMVQVVKEILSNHTKKNIRLEKISLIKFLKVINPTIEKNYLLTLKIQEEANYYKCDATISNELDVYFKMKNTYNIL